MMMIEHVLIVANRLLPLGLDILASAIHQSIGVILVKMVFARSTLDQLMC
jgi:hypothetical protein